MTGQEITFLKCSKKHQVKIIKKLCHMPKSLLDANTAKCWNRFWRVAPKPPLWTSVRTAEHSHKGGQQGLRVTAGQHPVSGWGLEALIRVSLGPMFAGQVHGKEAGLSEAEPGGQDAAQDQGGRRLGVGIAARWVLRSSDMNSANWTPTSGECALTAG